MTRSRNQMIYTLSGLVKHTSNQLVIIDVAGVGFGINVPSEHKYTKNSSVTLFTYMHFNPEQGPQLFGFETELEKTAFSYIISCSGIGPKIGLAVLNQLSAEQFLQAITIADYKALSSISGIGAKKAESMVLQLKDKISKLQFIPTTNASLSNIAAIKQVSQALDSLNYSRPEITMALEQIKEQGLQSATFDEMLRKALSVLAKRM